MVLWGRFGYGKPAAPGWGERLVKRQLKFGLAVLACVLSRTVPAYFLLCFAGVVIFFWESVKAMRLLNLILTGFGGECIIQNKDTVRIRCEKTVNGWRTLTRAGLWSSPGVSLGSERAAPAFAGYRKTPASAEGLKLPIT